jgi:hypothetical protein
MGRISGGLFHQPADIEPVVVFKRGTSKTLLEVIAGHF